MPMNLHRACLYQFYVICRLKKKVELNCMENGEHYIKRNFLVLWLNVGKLDVEVEMIWTWT